MTRLTSTSRKNGGPGRQLKQRLLPKLSRFPIESQLANLAPGGKYRQLLAEVPREVSNRQIDGLGRHRNANEGRRPSLRPVASRDRELPVSPDDADLRPGGHCQVNREITVQGSEGKSRDPARKSNLFGFLAKGTAGALENEDGRSSSAVDSHHEIRKAVTAVDLPADECGHNTRKLNPFRSAESSIP